MSWHVGLNSKQIIETQRGNLWNGKVTSKVGYSCLLPDLSVDINFEPFVLVFAVDYRFCFLYITFFSKLYRLPLLDPLGVVVFQHYLSE